MPPRMEPGPLKAADPIRAPYPKKSRYRAKEGTLFKKIRGFQKIPLRKGLLVTLRNVLLSAHRR